MKHKMAMEMQVLRDGENNNLPTNDDTLTHTGTGKGAPPFNWKIVCDILYQAFATTNGHVNNSSLPRDFLLITHRPRSCGQVRNKCLPKGQNYQNDLCAPKWRLLLDTGQTGSQYFLSANEDFIIKTISLKELNCLNGILPRLCNFLADNSETLLPRFFGLYTYKGGGKTIHFMVMNNLLPNHLYIDKRFDLKGATKRKKSASLFKDKEFKRTYPGGLLMEERYVNRLSELLELDCMHLRDLGLTNYSLFIAVHDVTLSNSDNQLRVCNNSIQKHTIPLEALGLLGSLDVKNRSLGVPAQISNNRKVLLYIGIIHILQPYSFGRKVEHFFKSILPGGDKAPVQPPRQFEERFMIHVRENWFKAP